MLEHRGGKRSGTAYAETADVFGNRPLSIIEAAPASLGQYGIQPETAAYFEIGWTRRSPGFKRQLVAPVHNNEGHFIGYTNLEPTVAGSTVRVTNGFDPSHELFNTHRALEFCRLRYGNPEVVLVQNVLDCIKVHQASIESVVGLLDDSPLSFAQEDLLASHFGNITIMMNPDSRGCGLAKRIAARLQRVVFVRIVSPPRALIELSSDEICNLLLS